MQAFFFLLSLTTGSRLVYILNHASWILNMKQVLAPPCLASDARLTTYHPVPTFGNSVGVQYRTAQPHPFCGEPGDCLRLGPLYETQDLLLNSGSVSRVPLY